MTKWSRPSWANFADVSDLVKLSTPIAISRMAVMLMSFTDAVVLSINTHNELPYILNAWLTIGVAIGIGMGLLQGVQVISSELLGVGKKEETGRVWRSGMVTAIISGIIASLLCWYGSPYLFHLLFKPEIAKNVIIATQIYTIGLVAHMVSAACMYYLEALRKPNTVTVIMFASVILNLLADLYLVAGMFGGMKLGFEGVAWATNITRFTLTTALLVVIVVATPGLKKSPRAPKDEFKRQLSVSLGTTISYIAEYSAFSLTIVFATWVSMAAATAYGMAIQFIGLTFMLFMGIATATSVRVAEFYGRKDYIGAREASRLGVATGVLIGTLLGALMFVFAEQLSVWTTMSDSSIHEYNAQELLTDLLRLSALMVLFDGLQVIGAYALRAQGGVWMPGIIHLGSYYLVMLPICLILAFTLGRGGQGVLEGAIIASFIAALGQVLYLEYITAIHLRESFQKE